MAAVASLLGGVVLLVWVCPPALALTGRAEVRGNTQEGVALGQSYRTQTLAETYQLGQRFAISPMWEFRSGYLARRENTESRSGLIRTKIKRVSLIPDLGLSFRKDPIRAGLTGNALRRDEFLEADAIRRDDRLDLGGWAKALTGPADVEARWQQTRAWRHEQADDRETRDTMVSLSALAHVSERDELSYKFSNLDHDVLTTDSFNRFRTHALSYSGDRAFAANKGRAFLQVRSSHFRQENRYGGGGSLELLQPIWGGFMLDDTPEISDPLEPEATALPSLFDNDRGTATTLDIGDAAAAVREFGGDYRNLVYEFGETRQVVTATVYVDTRLDFPEFMAWLVFVTTDPERRDWGTALGPGVVTAVYREWETGQQGWEFTFATPVDARSIKFVDVKRGPTAPNIAVTELEVYGPGPESAFASTLVRHRLIGEVGYQLTPDLHVRYNTDLSLRRFEDKERNLTGTNHTFGAQWRRGTWLLAGQHTINRLTSERETNTDANSQFVSLASDPARDLQGKLTWNRYADRSAGRDQVTNNWTAEGTWDIAPALVFQQRAGVGSRSFAAQDGTASTWFVVLGLRGSPKPNLSVDLRRSDRWAESEAGGTGFTTFNDTDLMVDWSLLPVVNWASLTRYQVRGDRSDWLVRNNVSWSPWPGTRLTPQFFVSDYQDTALDTMQRGGGASLTWRPFARLTIEGGAEELYIRQGGERNTPTNLHFRGNWTF